MLVTISKTNRVFQVVLFVVCALLLWGKNILFPPTPIPNIENDFLYPVLFSWLQNYPRASVLLALFCFCLQTAVLLWMLRSQKLSKEPMFVGVIYLLLQCQHFDTMTMHPFFIANLFLILSLNSLVRVYEFSESYQQVFDASCFLAIASFFYLPLIPLLLAIWVVLILYSINDWRQWLLSIFGFAVPYALLFAIFFLLGKSEELMQVPYDTISRLDMSLSFGNTYSIIYIGIFVLAALISVVYSLQNIKEFEVYQRMKIKAMVVMLLAASLIYLISSQVIISFSMFFIYAAYFIAEILLKIKQSYVSDILLGLFILFILLQNFIEF